MITVARSCRWLALRLSMLVGVTLTHGAAANDAVQRARFLMGTVCEVAVSGSRGDGERQIEDAFAEVKRVEEMLSTWTDESELARLNRGDGVASAELQALLTSVLDWSDRTDGAFDPRIRPLVDLWKTREAGALPDDAAIAAALEQVRGAKVAKRYSAAGFEEGAFGKGYAIDRALARIGAHEVMINFGGQIAVRGDLQVTIADPAAREHPVMAFTLTDGSLSTSSGSEKTFEFDGRRFSHIIDPRSGRAVPPRGSASVIAADALSADILSTALYVMGEDDALRWADANRVAAIFINSERHIRLSAAARERVRDLQLVDEKFSVKE